MLLSDELIELINEYVTIHDEWLQKTLDKPPMSNERWEEFQLKQIQNHKKWLEKGSREYYLIENLHKTIKKRKTDIFRVFYETNY